MATGAPRRVGYSLVGGRRKNSSAGFGMGQGYARDLGHPPRVISRSPHKDKHPKVRVPMAPAEKEPQTGGLWPWWGMRAKFVHRTRNEARLCEGRRCARGVSRAQPTKNNAQGQGTKMAPWAQNRVGYSLGGGPGRSSSAGFRMGRGFARDLGAPPGFVGRALTKDKRPKVRVPKDPSGKRPPKRVGFGLGGGRGRSSSPGFRMGRDFARDLRVPPGSRGHGRTQK